MFLETLSSYVTKRYSSKRIDINIHRTRKIEISRIKDFSKMMGSDLLFRVTYLSCRHVWSIWHVPNFTRGAAAVFSTISMCKMWPIVSISERKRSLCYERVQYAVLKAICANWKSCSKRSERHWYVLKLFTFNTEYNWRRYFWENRE